MKKKGWGFWGAKKGLKFGQKTGVFLGLKKGSTFGGKTGVFFGQKIGGIFGAKMGVVFGGFFWVKKGRFLEVFGGLAENLGFWSKMGGFWVKSPKTGFFGCFWENPQIPILKT